MEHYVIDGSRRLFGQFEVEDDVAALRAARPPLASHGADADGWGRNAEPGTPCRYEFVEARLQFAAVQPIQVALEGSAQATPCEKPIRRQRHPPGR